MAKAAHTTEIQPNLIARVIMGQDNHERDSMGIEMMTISQGRAIGSWSVIMPVY
jgi:hypothetical protein